MNIAYQVAILFLLVLTGMLCRRLKIMNDATIAGTTALVLQITLPCLTLYNMQREFSMEMLLGFLFAMLLGVITILIGLAVGYVLYLKKPKARRIVAAHVLAFSNCGFMGYPVILAVNPDWMIYAVAYNMAYNIVFWTAGAALYGTGNLRERLLKIVTNPTLIASVVGFVLFCFRFTWPGLLYDTLGTIGNITTPLSMLLIGTRVYGIRLSDLRDRDYVLLTALRLVLYPLAVLFVLKPLGIPAAVAGSMVVMTAMPAGSLVSMLAESEHGDVSFAARIVAFSTLISLVTIPVIASFL